MEWINATSVLQWIFWFIQVIIISNGSSRESTGLLAEIHFFGSYWFCGFVCRVSQYRFCQIMAENLPQLREEIKGISMSDLKDFLESIRKHSDKVGEMAMRQVWHFFRFSKKGNKSGCQLTDMSLKAQKHRTFKSALTKQACMGHYPKPVYSLIGPTHIHIHNGMMIDGDKAGFEEEADEEVKLCGGLSLFFT